MYHCPHSRIVNYSKSLADSITSTTISKAYKNSKIIQVASKAKGKLTDELMDYLIDKRNPIELKMALINELGWEFNGKTPGGVR